MCIAGHAVYKVQDLLEINGDFIQHGSKLILHKNGMKLSGDFRRTDGEFNTVKNKAKVVLNGKNQTIYGNNIFYVLVKHAKENQDLRFEAGFVQRIVSKVRSRAARNRKIALSSTEFGKRWKLKLIKGAKGILGNAKIQDGIFEGRFIFKSCKDLGNNLTSN